MADVLGRRAFTAAFATGLGGGVVAVFGASRSWAHVDAAAPGMPASVVAVSGGSALPWLAALAVVVCASWLAVLATAGAVRRAVGLVSLVAALGVAGGALDAGGAVTRAVADAVEASPTAVQGSGPLLAAQASGSVWPLLMAVGGFAAAAAAAAALLFGHRWPAMGRRYESPTLDRGPSSATPRPDPPDPADWWRQLDQGRDPTR